MVFEDTLDTLSLADMDKLMSDFIKRYKMGGVQGECEVKAATLECRWSGLRRQFARKGTHLSRYFFQFYVRLIFFIIYVIPKLVS